jgi:antitoxin (DNA-binding transcriptional repressor) of toxin-antitoxin stability system
MDEIEFPTTFDGLTEERLTEVNDQARAAAAPLVARVKAGEDLTDAELASLERLSAVVTSVEAARASRVAQAAVDSANTSRKDAAVAAFAADEDDDEDDEGEDKKKAKAPAKAKKDDDEGEGAVTASTKTRVADIAPHTPPTNMPAKAESSHTRAVAASGLPGYNAGHVFEGDDAIAKMAVAIEEQMGAYAGTGPGQYVKTPAVQWRREYPAAQRIQPNDDYSTTLEKVENVASQANLPGGSLVAAAGWCAPSQILYDLFELEGGNDGMLDLPEIQVSRGGIQFTPGPDFPSIFAGTGYFHQTEAQVIAATTKPCMVVPCPSFTDVRLEVEGVCITGAFLQDRGYPEMVARFVRGAMLAHRRKMNIFKINKVVAGSTLKDLTNIAQWPAIIIENDDLTAMSRLLAVVEAQIIDYKARHRMPDSATLEVVIPSWVKGQLRADVGRRTGTSAEQAFGVTDNMIEDWFRIRKARVQWVKDWQDFYNGGTGPGSATAINVLPTTVDILIYAAGTFVAGVADVIRLDTVYDSTNLALNQYTQLFTEEAILVAKRGFESRLVRLTIPPTGTTSAAVVMTNAV